MPVEQQAVKLQGPNKERVQFESEPVGRMLGQRSGLAELARPAEQQRVQTKDPNKRGQFELRSAERMSARPPESVEVQAETTEPESSLRFPPVLARERQA